MSIRSPQSSTLSERTIRNNVQDTLQLIYMQSVSPKRFIRFFRHLNVATLGQTVKRVGRQRLPSLASEMAFNAMLGLFPGILVLLTAIGLSPSLRDTFVSLAERLSQLAPEEVLTIIQNFVNEISNSQNRGLFSVSSIFAIWAFSGAISAAMRALDQIHQVPLAAARPFWKAKLISILLTIGTILLLIMACGLVFVSDLVIRNVASQSGEAVGSWVLSVWRLFSWPMALGIVSLAFALVYRFGPSRWIPGKPLLPGAMLAALSWATISGLFRLYVSHFGNYNKVYGAVGTVIVLLLWLQLSSLVMLIGDQLNVVVGEAMQAQQAARLKASPVESQTS